MTAATAIASERLETLLKNDPAVQAEKAYASGERRHIVLPVCAADRGEVIPGWPLHDSPEVRNAMDRAQPPLSCADFGEDSNRKNFIRAAKYAERYNRRLLELEGRAKK